MARRNSGVISRNSGVFFGTQSSDGFEAKVFAEQEGLLATYSLVSSWKSLLGHKFACIL